MKQTVDAYIIGLCKVGLVCPNGVSPLGLDSLLGSSARSSEMPFCVLHLPSLLAGRRSGVWIEGEVAFVALTSYLGQYVS